MIEHTDGRTQKRTGKTRNAAYKHNRIIKY